MVGKGGRGEGAKSGACVAVGSMVDHRGRPWAKEEVEQAYKRIAGREVQVMEMKQLSSGKGDSDGIENGKWLCGDLGCTARLPLLAHGLEGHLHIFEYSTSTFACKCRHLHGWLGGQRKGRVGVGEAVGVAVAVGVDGRALEA